MHLYIDGWFCNLNELVYWYFFNHLYGSSIGYAHGAEYEMGSAIYHWLSIGTGDAYLVFSFLHEGQFIDKRIVLTLSSPGLAIPYYYTVCVEGHLHDGRVFAILTLWEQSSAFYLHEALAFPDRYCWLYFEMTVFFNDWLYFFFLNVHDLMESPWALGTWWLGLFLAGRGGSMWLFLLVFVEALLTGCTHFINTSMNI